MESKLAGGNPSRNSSEGGKRADRITTLVFFISVLVFFTGYNFSDNPPNGWYLQTMPDLNGASIKDITFTDSLNGYAVTNIGNNNSYILKTANRGDNWSIVYTYTYPFSRIEFVTANIGFTNSFTKLFKTTNAGYNWDSLDLPGIFGDDMSVLNKDTIWLAMSEPLTGGVFRTTNGGVNWTQQLSAGNQNPDKIYMYNARIGFIVRNNSGAINLRKTTDGGNNWFTVVMNEGFYDMYFADSLTGWRVKDYVKKTTDGGLTWIQQTIPQGIPGHTIVWGIRSISKVSKDTLWGGYPTVVFPNSSYRGLIFRTTNGGSNWFYQIPDTTNITIPVYDYINFKNNRIGWAYGLNSGIHTLTGGDTTFLSSVRQISTEVPGDYRLYQNYPNPFNQSTIFNLQLSMSGNTKLTIFDVSGREITTLINERLQAGTYQTRWDAESLSSGIYFYSLIVNGKVIDTKKAMLIK